MSNYVIESSIEVTSNSFIVLICALCEKPIQSAWVILNEPTCKCDNTRSVVK